MFLWGRYIFFYKTYRFAQSFLERDLGTSCPFHKVRSHHPRPGFCKSRFSQAFRMEMASLLFMPLFRINPQGGGGDVNRDRVSFCGSRKSSELKFAKHHHPLLQNNFLFKCSRTCLTKRTFYRGVEKRREEFVRFNFSEMKKNS